MSNRWPILLRPKTALLLLAVLLCAPGLRAQTALNLTAYQQKAGALFGTEQLSAADSPLATACESLLLITQAASVTLIVAGLIAKTRQDHQQMDGVAAMLLKVAFIATIPLWSTRMLETVDTAADAVGQPAIHTDGSSTPLMNSLWSLAGQWMPARSPYLDALDSQDSQNAPTSGDEQAWSMRAWNWARGITATTNTTFDTSWHSLTGTVRATIVFLGCAAMACLSLLTIFGVYLAGVARVALYSFGCALLPLFIAALGLDSLRPTATRYILRLVGFASWPIGWAVANVITLPILTGASDWMTQLVAAATGLTATDPNLPSTADAAPFLAWGVLLLLIALNLVICLWILGSLALVPSLISKAIAGGLQVVERTCAQASHGRFSFTIPTTPVVRSSETSAPLAHRNRPRATEPSISRPPTVGISQRAPAPTRSWLPPPRTSITPAMIARASRRSAASGSVDHI